MRPYTLSRLLLRQSYISRSTCPSRAFSTTRSLDVVKPFYLADIGEGIRECEIIQWFVEPEARVEEFDKICEVQSDKASVDIPSRFSGVIKKLHYEAGEMAIVGKPLIDIDVPEEVAEEIEKEEESGAVDAPDAKDPKASSNAAEKSKTEPQAEKKEEKKPAKEARKEKGSHSSLATPAVRHLSKELDVDINDVDGTGRDGRVTKEDLQKFQENRDSQSTSSSPQAKSFSPPAASSGPQQETTVPLTTTQSQMFKTMTRSLTIPHFVYSDEFDITALSALRTRLNSTLTPSSPHPKLSYLPFIIKAMSLALHQYPILNARLQIDPSTQKPTLIHRSHHNIGIAMDTPSGLLVPVLKNASSLSISEIASSLSHLQSLSSTSSFTSSDLSGGTITVTNIGSIGGTYVSPVIVDSQVAIMGVGKIKEVPGFGKDGELVRRKVVNVSWSADHRVVDGATVARASEVVRGFLEGVENMVLHLR